MKDVGNVTRVMPDKRVESLMKFRRRLADNPDVNTKFAQVLCKIIDTKKLLCLDPKRTKQLGITVQRKYRPLQCTNDPEPRNSARWKQQVCCHGWRLES